MRNGSSTRIAPSKAAFFLLAITTVIHPAGLSALNAEEDRRLMVKAYADCQTLSATGTSRSRTGLHVDNSAFRFDFSRPGSYRFERIRRYPDLLRLLFGDQLIRNIVWSNGKEVFTQPEDNRDSDPYYFPFLVLTRLLRLSDPGQGFSLDRLQDLHSAGTESMGGSECHRITGIFKNRVVSTWTDLWIDQSTHLLLRLETRYQSTTGATVRNTLSFKNQLNEPIPDLTFSQPNR